MLPLLLGLGGSALGASGAIAGLGALGAGAIGSGLGSYLETGDLGKGIQTGLLSYFGGKALGGMFGGAEGAAGADAVGAATQATPAAQMAADPMLAGTNVPTELTTGAMSGNLGSSVAPQTSFLGDPTATMTANATGSTLGQAMSASSPYTLSGAAVGALPDLMAPPEFEMAPKKQYNTEEAEAANRERFTPGADFRPGISPEFNYFGPMQTSFADGGLASLKYQEGGEMPNDKELISEAVDAIQGRNENPERTLAMFVSRYGEDALRDLVDRVQSGEFNMNADVSEGTLVGAGDGMDDMIPATLEGEQDVVLSDGEFIVPADVVSGLGNGSTNAGSKALYEMMDRVREMRTGQKEQPDQVPQDMMLPA